MDIGKRIRMMRENLGMTQDDLAKKLGYASRSSVNKVENSKEISMKKIKLYANALNTDIPTLMGWSIEDIANIDVELTNIPAHLKAYTLKLSKLSQENQELIMNMIDKLS